MAPGRPSAKEFAEMARKLAAAEQTAQQDRALRQQAEEREQQAQEREQQERERAQRAEQLTEDTSLLQYMDAVHLELYQKIKVESNPMTTTQGHITSPTGRLIPTKIRYWNEFESIQKEIWDTMGTADPNFFLKKQFESAHFLHTLGGRISSHPISSEADLTHVTQQALEHPVATILSKIGENVKMAKALGFKGSVSFQNHGNGLDDNTDETVDRLNTLALSTPTKGSGPSSTSGFARSLESKDNQHKGYMHADQICVYEFGDEKRVPTFIIEYKPPHKLTLEMISIGLRDMNPSTDIVHSVLITEDPATAHAKLVVAAAVTQTFDYMVQSRLQYGYVCTGLAFIFLYINEEDPTTVYYYRSMPGDELEGGTRWQAGSSEENLLHATALGRIAVFCVQALQRRQLTDKWLKDAMSKLERWDKDYERMLQQIPETIRKKARSTPYKVSHSIKQKDLRSSPIWLRSRPPATKSQCNPSSLNPFLRDKPDDDSDDEEKHNDSDAERFADGSPRPSRKGKKQEPASSGGKQTGRQRSYCTQQCLLGLLQQSRLDEQCPNVDEHRKLKGCHHDITQQAFLRLMQKQLGEDLDNDVEPWYVTGSRGVMFKVTLSSHGYTVAAKATTFPWVTDLRHEESVYHHLHELQGDHIPVCLGNIDLEEPYHYTARCILIHMMFLAYVGKSLTKQKVIGEVSDLSKQATDAIDALHRYGVSHRDVALRNMFWNEELNRVLFIDFERSVLFGPDTPEQRKPLGVVSLNATRKRKRDPQEQEKFETSDDTQEAAEAMSYKIVLRNKFDKSPISSCQSLFKSEVQETSYEIAKVMVA